MNEVEAKRIDTLIREGKTLRVRSCHEDEFEVKFADMSGDRWHLLLLNFIKNCKSPSWISKKHDDGSERDGWFIVGVTLPQGPISYHLPSRLWGFAEPVVDEILEIGKRGDGHTSQDVTDRLFGYLLSESGSIKVETTL